MRTPPRSTRSSPATWRGRHRAHARGRGLPHRRGLHDLERGRCRGRRGRLRDQRRRGGGRLADRDSASRAHHAPGSTQEDLAALTEWWINNSDYEGFGARTRSPAGDGEESRGPAGRGRGSSTGGPRSPCSPARTPRSRPSGGTAPGARALSSGGGAAPASGAAAAGRAESVPCTTPRLAAEGVRPPACVDVSRGLTDSRPARCTLAADTCRLSSHDAEHAVAPAAQGRRRATTVRRAPAGAGPCTTSRWPLPRGAADDALTDGRGRAPAGRVRPDLRRRSTSAPAVPELSAGRDSIGVWHSGGATARRSTGSSRGSPSAPRPRRSTRPSRPSSTIPAGRCWCSPGPAPARRRRSSRRSPPGSTPASTRSRSSS